MQTSCELCGRIIEPTTPGSDSWRLAFSQPLNTRQVPPQSPATTSYAPGDVRLGAMNVVFFGDKFAPGNDGQYRIKPRPQK